MIQPFKYPCHGPKFGYATVNTNGGIGKWRLCRYPRCETCSTSPPTILTHKDCYSLAKRNCRALNSLYIRLASSTSSPCVVEYSAHWDFGSLLVSLAKITMGTIVIVHPGLTPKICELIANYYPESEIVKAIYMLARLPLEICQAIASYCSESLLWRIASSVNWQPAKPPTRQLLD